MPRQVTKHSEIFEAIRRTDSIAELVEKTRDHFKHELELEVIVYGRNYAGKKVGPYVRLLTYEAGEQIIQQGDIGTNTFYLLVEGTLDVHVRDEEAESDPTKIGLKIAELKPDTSFGEMAILAGVPRNATVCVPAGGEARVLEFTRPALRLLRKLKRFGERLDRTYRDHGLGRTLEDLRQVGGDLLDRELLTDLRGIARFAIYGKNHVLTLEGARIEHVLLIKNGWLRRVSGEMSSLSLANAALNADLESGVDFLGSGNCLGLEAANTAKSFDATLHQPPHWRSTAVVLARTEVIEIPLDALRQNARLCERLVKAFERFSVADGDVDFKTSDEQKIALVAAEREITTGVVDGTNLLVMDMDLCIRCGNCSLACHKVHGQSRLLRRGIHIERPRHVPPVNESDTATPRFPFGNVSFPISSATQHVLSPAVCMHCQDPECLTGCPTGAIGWNASGEIDINASTCIGCGDCATQCPYDAISMVSRGGGGAKSKRGAIPAVAPPSRFVKMAKKLGAVMRIAPPPLPAAVTETEDLLAVKCNLCHDTGMNPKGRLREAYSCQENCPTGALVRVNPREYFTEVGRTLGVRFQDSTHAVGRNIHRRDSAAQVWHAAGSLITIALSVLTVLGLLRFGFDTPVITDNTLSPWLTMRWLTGFVGLFGVAIVMTYPLRKSVYRRRAGALRYWMLAHIYLGAITGIVLLLHGGTRTGGLLTSALMLSFDLVILSGLVGLFTYLIAPRIMTSIEGEPLLIEDLQARRAELRRTLADIVTKSDASVREIITRRARKRFFTLRYLLRHYLRREPLTVMLARAREEYEPVAAKLGVENRRALLDAIETIVTMRRVDALIYLHLMLKAWVAPHVVSTAVMLALMVVHVVQVVFLRVG